MVGPATECDRVKQQMDALKDDVSVKSVSAYSQLCTVYVCACVCVYSCVSSLPINNR